MLDGETKRREIALAWLTEVSEILEPVGLTLWGSRDSDDSRLIDTITIRNYNEEGKLVRTKLFYRYAEYASQNGMISFPCGFRMLDDYNSVTKVEELKGTEFWDAIEVIMNWLQIVIEGMDKKEIRRDALTAKMNTDIA